MGKVFLEYKISAEDREEFVSWMKSSLSLQGSAELYEGTDQRLVHGDMGGIGVCGLFDGEENEA